MNKLPEFINGRPVGMSDRAWGKLHEIIAHVLIRLANEKQNRKEARYEQANA